MTGDELKVWRTANGLTQRDLMNELGVTSRQTMTNYEKANVVPRIVELAVIALDQVAACRNLNVSGSQFTESDIIDRASNFWKKHNRLHEYD